MTELGCSFYVKIKNVTKALLAEDKTNILAMRCYMNGFGCISIIVILLVIQQLLNLVYERVLGFFKAFSSQELHYIGLFLALLTIIYLSIEVKNFYDQHIVPLTDEIANKNREIQRIQNLERVDRNAIQQGDNSL